MKWLALIILVMFAGAFFYWFYSDDTGAWQGTPLGPAKDFVYAATEGDYRGASYECVPEIEAQATEVAERINAQNVDPRAIVFKGATDNASTLTALVNGKILTIELTERAPEDWVITKVDLDR